MGSGYHMKKIIKRGLSVLLCLAVLCGFVPLGGSIEIQAQAKNITQYSKGEIIRFGWYPQSAVTDSATISKLNEQAQGDVWTSYGYYSGTGDSSDGKMLPGDYMQFVDVFMNGNKYRGVHFTSYRPDTTGGTGDETEQRTNHYYINHTYWFKFEPIQWRILDPDAGLVMSESILDSQPFNQYNLADGVDTSGKDLTYGDEGKTHYANNYARSSLRQWLTAPEENSFLVTAFSSEQRASMKVTDFHGETGMYRTDDFSDSLFLLSSGEVCRTAYGFSSRSSDQDAARKGMGTDYAKCQGLSVGTSKDNNGYSRWHLRNVGSASGNVRRVYSAGEVNDAMFTGSTNGGVRPAMYLKLDADILQSEVDEVGILCAHTNTKRAEGKEPTCTEPGYTGALQCVDCETILEESQVISAPGHQYAENVVPPTESAGGFTEHTCSRCGDYYTDEPTSALPHTTCKFVFSKVVAPTCKEQGYDLYLCSVCGKEKKENYTGQLPHSYAVTVISPTEEAGGYTLHTCTVCAYSYKSDETSKLPHATHKYELTESIEATCTEEGVMVYHCSVCSLRKTEYVQVLGHDFTHVTVPATCTTEGMEYDRCQRCEKVYNQATLPVAHNYKDGICVDCGHNKDWKYEIKAGTCIITGYTGNEIELEIPSAIQGTPVTRIAKSAFSGNVKLEYVCVPDSVLYVDENAFRGCLALREVYLGRNIGSLESGAFANCPSLALVCIDTEDLRLSDRAFSGNDSRITFISPDNTKTSKYLKNFRLNCVTYVFPDKRGNDLTISFKGNLYLYDDLDYHYWNVLTTRCAGAKYMHFEFLMLDGVPRDLVGDAFDARHVDMDSPALTFRDIYMSVTVNGEQVTFDRLSELVMGGEADLVLTFDDNHGGILSIFERIGGIFAQMFNVLTRVVNSIIRIFKKK